MNREEFWANCWQDYPVEKLFDSEEEHRIVAGWIIAGNRIQTDDPEVIIQATEPTTKKYGKNIVLKGSKTRVAMHDFVSGYLDDFSIATARRIEGGAVPQFREIDGETMAAKLKVAHINDIARFFCDGSVPLIPGVSFDGDTSVKCPILPSLCTELDEKRPGSFIYLRGRLFKIVESYDKRGRGPFPYAMISTCMVIPPQFEKVGAIPISIGQI